MINNLKIVSSSDFASTAQILFRLGRFMDSTFRDEFFINLGTELCDRIQVGRLNIFFLKQYLDYGRFIEKTNPSLSIKEYDLSLAAIWPEMKILTPEKDLGLSRENMAESEAYRGVKIIADKYGYGDVFGELLSPHKHSLKPLYLLCHRYNQADPRSRHFFRGMIIDLLKRVALEDTDNFIENGDSKANIVARFFNQETDRAVEFVFSEKKNSADLHLSWTLRVDGCDHLQYDLAVDSADVRAEYQNMVNAAREKAFNRNVFIDKFFGIFMRNYDFSLDSLTDSVVYYFEE